MIDTMIRSGKSAQGDVFLDYEVCGNILNRPGLSALTTEVTKDTSVTHILIPRRDRLARAGTQKGKARSRHPDQNPLGGRVYDMSCGWLMYRAPYLKSFRYSCGLYSQSHGARCHHNHVPGPLAAEFALSVIRQKLLAPGVFEKLKCRLLELAVGAGSEDESARQIELKADQLARAKADVETAARNMALAKNGRQLAAMQKVFDAFEAKVAKLEDELTAVRRVSTPRTAKADVEAAIDLAERLTDLASEPDGLKIAGEVVTLADLKLYLRFQQVKTGKGTLNRLAGGIVTLGSATPPIVPYAGKTDRESVNATKPTTRNEWSACRPRS